MPIIMGKILEKLSEGDWALAQSGGLGRSPNGRGRGNMPLLEDSVVNIIDLLFVC